MKVLLGICLAKNSQKFIRCKPHWSFAECKICSWIHWEFIQRNIRCKIRQWKNLWKRVKWKMCEKFIEKFIESILKMVEKFSHAKFVWGFNGGKFAGNWLNENYSKISSMGNLLKIHQVRISFWKLLKWIVSLKFHLKHSITRSKFISSQSLQRECSNDYKKIHSVEYSITIRLHYFVEIIKSYWINGNILFYKGFHYCLRISASSISLVLSGIYVYYHSISISLLKISITWL